MPGFLLGGCRWWVWLDAHRGRLLCFFHFNTTFDKATVASVNIACESHDLSLGDAKHRVQRADYTLAGFGVGGFVGWVR